MKKIGYVLAALLVLLFFQKIDFPDSTTDAAGGIDSVATAFVNRQSKVWVEVSGEVSRVLQDDNEGSRHQRFILKLANDHTLLVSHNIDLAKRIPLSEGDKIVLKGRYEWNERGGVVHWTHHDPQGRHSGGWIRHEGQEYY